MKSIKLIPVIFIPFLLFCQALPLFAEELESRQLASEKWYEVQLVIFLNKAAPSSEQWPDNQASAIIPVDAVTLKSAGQLAAESQETKNQETDREVKGNVVEVERDTTTALDSEQGSNKNPPVPVETSISLQQPDPIRNLMVWLPLSGSFAAIAAKLKASGSYPVLYTARWRMPLTTFRQPHVFVVQTTDEKNGAALSGTFSLSAKRFYYIDADLTYCLPGTNNVRAQNRHQQQNTAKCFPMVDTRQLILKNLTYLDNPVYGILIQMTPYSLP